jgi:polyhydroxyalkanoate synthesis regulator phasin
MTLRKIFLIISLSFGLVFVGFIAVNKGVEAFGVGKWTEKLDEWDESISQRVEELFGKLEKKELGTSSPSSLVITPPGGVTMTNVDLEEINDTNLKVGLFGLSFNIDASSAKILGGGREVEISDLNVGDKLLIKGTVESGVIKAFLIHDRSLRKKRLEELREKIRTLLEKIRQLQEELEILSGTTSS